jgi:hypothetical protein
MLETLIYVMENSIITIMRVMTTVSRYFRTTAILLEISRVSFHSFSKNFMLLSQFYYYYDQH